MQVEVHYRLTGGFTVVLYQIEPIRMEIRLHFGGDLFGYGNGIACSILRQGEEILVVILRKDQCVSFGGRTEIEDHAESVVLINGSGRDLPVCDLAENTVGIFHILMPPVFIVLCSLQ